MRYRVTHVTKYAGDKPVSVGHNEARLRPRQLAHQHCAAHELRIEPTPSVLTEWDDNFGNAVASFSFNYGYDALTVTAQSDVILLPREPAGLEIQAPSWNFVRERLRAHRTLEDLQAYEFAFDSPQAESSAELADYALPAFAVGRPILEAVADFTARVRREFRYEPRSTHVATRVAEVLHSRRGVCQDFAHLAVAALRSLGLAARYVSGYLRTYPPAGKPRLVGADASHAWVSVYCGDAGWVDFDPTNNAFVGTEHVTLAWGRDFQDVSPLKGVFVGGGEHRLTVSVDVEPQAE